MNKKPSQKKERKSFAKTQVRTPLPNLIETQKLSYDAFLQRDVPPNERKNAGLQAVFNEIFRTGEKSGIRDYSNVNSLEFVNYKLGDPKYTRQECVERGVTYEVSLTASIQLVLREEDPDPDADEPHIVEIRESDVYLGEVPLMTEDGSFIFNGSERVIVSQLHRSPGVIFLEKTLSGGRRTPTAQIIPYRGAWVEFEIDTKDQIYVRIDKRKKLPATVLLRALGWESDADILKLYTQTERIVLDGWKVTHVEEPATHLAPGDVLDAAAFKQAEKDYPDLETEKFYRVEAVTETDADCPVEPGQELTVKDRARLRRKWKGFETTLLRRVIGTHTSGCELTVGQTLTNSEYEKALDRYGSDTFTVERFLSEDSKESVERVCAEDVINPETGEVLLTANTLITETELERLSEAGVEALTVLDREGCQHIRSLRNTLERDRQADYILEELYRVEKVKLKPGQELTGEEYTRLSKDWKGLKATHLWRVIGTPTSGCELTREQDLTDSQYKEALDRYGSEAFTKAEEFYRVEAVTDADPLEPGQELTVKQWEHLSKDWKGLKATHLWRVIYTRTLTSGDVLDDAEYQEAKKDYPDLEAEEFYRVEAVNNCPLKRGQELTGEEWEHLSKGWKGLVTLSWLGYKKDALKDAALLTIFRTLRPGDPAGVESARKHLRWLLFDPHRYDLGIVGRYKLNRKFGNIPVYGEPPEETLRTLRPADIASTVAYLLNVHNGEDIHGEKVPKDDLDHLGNRRVRVIGELLENQCRSGLFNIRRTTRDRLSTTSDIAKVVPSSLINPKPLMMAVREFFGSNQLSQFMQQINPLDELTHKRRISAIGPGGLHRDRATAAVRDVHQTHYGRVCPLETPEGPSIGLIVSLACYGRINPYGFIETPYHKVEEGEDGPVLGNVEYLAADREDTSHIAAKPPPSDTASTGNGDTGASEHILPVRRGEDVLSLPMEKVDYIGVSPQQIVGISAALVPFLEHEDANRALMGANHQRQAVPLVSPEAPLVGTGMEAPAAQYSGALITAKRPGTVTSVSADEILIYAGAALHQAAGENTFSEMGYDVYKLQTFKRSNGGTCIHQHPIVAVGDTVEEGQVIADGPSTENGELALGRNVLCAYMPWGGHNYEDSILISETLIKADTFTSIHIEEFEVEARETKVGPEEITRDIPNVSEQRLTQLDEEGIIRVGSIVGAGSILVGKITPKGESDSGAEEKLLRAIFGEKVKDVKDASTYVRPGVEGVVIDVQVFSRKMGGSGNAVPSMSDTFRYESKHKQIEEASREQIASIRRRKDEEIRKTLIGCELAEALHTVKATEGEGQPLTEAGDTLTAAVLDTYLSGFTADESHVVTEGCYAETFIAEAVYKVTDVPEPMPTLVVQPSDSAAGLQDYLSEVCQPILEGTAPVLIEAEPGNESAAQTPLIAGTDAVLYGNDNSVIAIVICEEVFPEPEDAFPEEVSPENGGASERLELMLAAAGARFGVLVSDSESDPDTWDFYEIVEDTEAHLCARTEFETGVTEQLKATRCPVTEAEELSEEKWANLRQKYPGLQAELTHWRVKAVFDPACSLTVDATLSDSEYQQASKEFPARPIAAGQRLTADELAALNPAVKDLKTDREWNITAIFDPACTLPIGEYVSDADYQQARNSCSLSLSDIHVTDDKAKAHIQRIEEMAQGRIAAYTEEKERALKQLEQGDELKPGVIKRVKVYVASKRPISVGDKMAGRYGNKGVVAKILPAEDMPYLPDGTPVELVLNPLGVPSRMNVGQILEIHLGWACHELGIRVESPVFDGATEKEIFEELGKTDLPERSKRTGKSLLFDGRTGEPFAQEVTVGYVYFLKLNHLVADKMHARSTGPYSLVTQQPLGGKAQHGGQRLGEMEVWALEAYGAAHTLQEMLTLKSDDVVGRREIYEAVVKGVNPEPPGTPESFKVLVRELQTLGLHVSLDPDED